MFFYLLETPSKNFKNNKNILFYHSLIYEYWRLCNSIWNKTEQHKTRLVGKIIVLFNILFYLLPIYFIFILNIIS